MAFERERSEFLRFSKRLAEKPEVLEQMERAIEEVYWTYDTAIRENRFVVGGVTEFIVGTAERSAFREK